MKLPRADQAIVDGAKVRDYLRSLEHPVGRFKAAFFGSLGYTRDQWQRLQQDLLQLGQSGAAEQREQSAFGRKYEVRGILQGPSGGRGDRDRVDRFQWRAVSAVRDRVSWGGTMGFKELDTVVWIGTCRSTVSGVAIWERSFMCIALTDSRRSS
jgi:hypothetical protein